MMMQIFMPNGILSICMLNLLVHKKTENEFQLDLKIFLKQTKLDDLKC